MSSLENYKHNPAQHIENGHGSSLRVGKAFIFDAAVEALAAAAALEVRFTTGDSAVLFETGDINTNQEKVLFEVYEDTTFTAPGSLVTTLIKNMNRLLANASEIATYTSPTVDADGELVIHQIAVGVAGQNQNQPGFGGSGQDVSFVLKPNTEHMFRITNQSLLAVNVEAHYHFHEVDPKQYN